MSRPKTLKHVHRELALTSTASSRIFLKAKLVEGKLMLTRMAASCGIRDLQGSHTVCIPASFHNQTVCNMRCWLG